MIALIAGLIVGSVLTLVAGALVILRYWQEGRPMAMLSAQLWADQQIEATTQATIAQMRALAKRSFTIHSDSRS